MAVRSTMLSFKGFLKFFFIATRTTSNKFGDIRLVDGPSSKEGRLEMFDGYRDYFLCPFRFI